MNATALFVAVLAYFIIFAFRLTYVWRAANPTNPHEKNYLIFSSVSFSIMLLGLLSIVILAAVSGVVSGDQAAPTSVIAGLAVLCFGMVGLGLTLVIFAKDAATLFQRRRETGTTGKWVINSLPQRERFVAGGWYLTVLGFFMLLLAIYVLATNNGQG